MAFGLVDREISSIRINVSWTFRSIRIDQFKSIDSNRSKHALVGWRGAHSSSRSSFFSELIESSLEFRRFDLIDSKALLMHGFELRLVRIDHISLQLIDTKQQHWLDSKRGVFMDSKVSNIYGFEAGGTWWIPSCVTAMDSKEGNGMDTKPGHLMDSKEGWAYRFEGLTNLMDSK